MIEFRYRSLIHDIRNAIIMQEQELNFRHFHDDGADYLKLHMICPACFDERILNNHQTEWFHDIQEDGTPCGGEMYIGDNGYYCCSKCLYKAPIFEWRYRCPKCDEHVTKSYLTVIKGRYVGRVPTIRLLPCFETSRIGLRWSCNLTRAIIEQYQE